MNLITRVQFTAMSQSKMMIQQTKHRVSKLKKFRQFLKTLKSKVNKTKRDSIPAPLPVFLPTVNESPCESLYPSPYSYTYTYFRPESRPRHTPLPAPFLATNTLKQHKPKPTASSMFSESEYEEMSSDFCTLPRKKMKYRMKHRVFEKSLNAILMEARQEIIEESSGDEADDTYVAEAGEAGEAGDNLYEELDLSYSSVDEIYEEIF